MEKYVKNWIKFLLFVSALGGSLFAISFYSGTDDFFYSTFYKLMYVQRLFAYIIAGLIGISGLLVIGISIYRNQNDEKIINRKEDISKTEKNKKFWIKILILLIPQIIVGSLWLLNYWHLYDLVQILQNLTFSDSIPGVYYYIHYQTSDVSYSVGFWVISLMILTVIIERWAPWVVKNDQVNYRKINPSVNEMDINDPLLNSRDSLNHEN